MKEYPISISKVYVLLNKVLNTLIRRNFGKHYSIRLNSLTFISNRSNVNYFQTSSEKITIKSLKPIHLNELLLIKEFLLFNRLHQIFLSVPSQTFCFIFDDVHQ